MITLSEYVDSLVSFLKDNPDLADKTVYGSLDDVSGFAMAISSEPSRIFIDSDSAESDQLDSLEYTTYLDEALDDWGKGNFSTAVIIH